MQFTPSTSTHSPILYGVNSTTCKAVAEANAVDDPVVLPCPWCGSREGDYEDESGWSRCLTCGGN